MSQLYHLLTGEELKHGGTNNAEQEVYQLTNVYYRKLLIIIDDVWYVDDALPLVKAFSSCKIILTTRMNDIERWIPSQQSSVIGPMEEHEAVSLLTKGIISSSQLSHECETSLIELAQDVHLWPLLLSLVRGQLSHYLKKYQLSFPEAISNVQKKLHDRGLIAFDPKDIQNKNSSRELAVNVCIETTLDLLNKSLSDKIKILILWTGIGTSLQTAVLNNLWNITKQGAEETVDTLWGYGLVQFTNVAVYLHLTNITQHCVEVHAVISQYIIDSIDSKEVGDLSPFVGFSRVTSHVAVRQALMLLFNKQLRETCNAKASTCEDFLKYHLHEIQNFTLPYSLKEINMHIITNPHMIILNLQRIKDCLMNSPYSIQIHMWALLGSDYGKIDNLIFECKEILKGAHKMCRKINQEAQKYIIDNDYDQIIQIVENFRKSYCLGDIAQRAVTVTKKIIPYCEGEALVYMKLWCEDMHTMTTDYHCIKILILPGIKLLVKALKQIKLSLERGIPSIEVTYHYFLSGKFVEEQKLMYDNYLIKLQEVSPSNVIRMASENSS